MLHSFFDAHEYPLHRPGAAELLWSLTHACPEAARIELYCRRSNANLLAFDSWRLATDSSYTPELVALGLYLLGPEPLEILCRLVLNLPDNLAL